MSPEPALEAQSLCTSGEPSPVLGSLLASDFHVAGPPLGAAPHALFTAVLPLLLPAWTLCQLPGLALAPHGYGSKLKDILATALEPKWLRPKLVLLLSFVWS